MSGVKNNFHASGSSHEVEGSIMHCDKGFWRKKRQRYQEQDWEFNFTHIEFLVTRDSSVDTLIVRVLDSPRI